MNECRDASAAPELLRLEGLSARFGGVRAVNEVSLGLREGELIGLIGPNGAGKSTILNLISGSVTPSAGDILFKGESILGLAPDRLCHRGISRTFQNIRLFPQMTVFENVALGLHSEPGYSAFEAFLRTPRVRRLDKEVEKRALELLAIVDLEKHARERAGALPYGLQRRLELARAMATGPSLLLLDEPAAGMNEDECESLIELLEEIRGKFGYGMILIEHHMHVVMSLCCDSTIYVLNLGEILTSGSPEEIQNDPRVISAYLGDKRTGHGRSRRRLS